MGESRRKFIHLRCCTPPDHLSNVNRFHDVLFVSSAFPSFVCVILQAGLTVGRDRCANCDQFFDPIIKLHGDLLFPLIQVRFLRTMYDSRAPRLKSVHCFVRCSSGSQELSSAKPTDASISVYSRNGYGQGARHKPVLRRSPQYKADKVFQRQVGSSTGQYATAWNSSSVEIGHNA